MMTFKTLPDRLMAEPFFVCSSKDVFYDSPWVITFKMKTSRADVITGVAFGTDL